MQPRDIHVTGSKLKGELGITVGFRSQPLQISERCADNQLACLGGSRRLADFGIDVEQLVGQAANLDETALGNDTLVIGHELALTLGAEVGETLLVTSPQGELTPLGLVPRYQRFRVVGIFSSGFYQYDDGYAFMRLSDAQRLFSEPDLVSVISFKIDDLYKAEQVGKAIEAQGIQDFQNIVTKGITDPLLKWKGIEATEKLANSPNAKVVIVGGKDGLPIILGQQ